MSNMITTPYMIARQARYDAQCAARLADLRAAWKRVCAALDGTGVVVELFGSTARGDVHPRSDLDILLVHEGSSDFWTIGGWISKAISSVENNIGERNSGATGSVVDKSFVDNVGHSTEIGIEFDLIPAADAPADVLERMRRESVVLDPR